MGELTVQGTFGTVRETFRSPEDHPVETISDYINKKFAFGKQGQKLESSASNTSLSEAEMFDFNYQMSKDLQVRLKI